MSRVITISTREIQVAELISFGATEKEISNYLELSVDTVKVHKKHLFLKTGCHNIADITRWFFQRKIGVILIPSEKIRKFLALVFLAIMVSAEALDTQFIRPGNQLRPIRRVSGVRVRVRRAKRKELEFIAA